MNDKQIKKIAESLLPTFAPKDETETELSFNFTLSSNQTYKVWFEKRNKVWVFIKAEKVVVL